MITPYHARYYAHELTNDGGVGIDRLGRALFDATVDLNPHQIEAALFAMRSPLQKGVLLADEVGLGKTIEAGLAICQYWAERHRRILVISPASLRKQWELELNDKFNIPVQVLDTKTYRDLAAGDSPNPFYCDSIVVCSIHFASRRAEEVRSIQWDLIIIDEAHKLRNSYRLSNRMGQNIRWALEDRRKILLTATPLQNSLLELYGLATVIDDRLFGDLPSFRTQYCGSDANISDLRDRLEPFCTRTLRRQVVEYIPYTDRKLITRPFRPTDNEYKLYESISSFLQREDSYSLPKQQKHLITLIIRKVLASSPYAVAGTFEMMRDRLIRLKENTEKNHSVVEQLILNGELDEDLLDELLEDQEELSDGETTDEAEPATKTLPVDLLKLQSEIDELNSFIRWAHSIGIDSKAKNLLKALDIGFSEMAKSGGARKAVIFTESRRTQAHLRDYLEANGYTGQVLTFNGSNREPETTAIYNKWIDKNKDTGRLSGSRMIDVRTAIIETFQQDASIMIATEAAAEGINLQFCSLVINFDLPWNPQRIEQRIGRCHRYGQKHDVVVINFLNERNAADRRVYELLEQKFNLFNGVFGASDEVLGTIESGAANIPGEFLYRLSHPLGEYVLHAGKTIPAPLAEVVFNITDHPVKISVIEKLKGKSGSLILQQLSVDSFEREEYLLFPGFCDNGKTIEQETCEKLFHCAGITNDDLSLTQEMENRLSANAKRHVQASVNRSLEINNKHFNEAREQLDKWAEDMEIAAGHELEDTKRQVKALNRQARQSPTVENNTIYRNKYVNWKRRNAVRGNISSIWKMKSSKSGIN